jgi:hypothetical protein
MNENYFYINKSNSIDGFSPTCKKCEIKRSQGNYDPKRHTELTNHYYHTDPEYRKRKIGYAQTDIEKQKTANWRKSEIGKAKGKTSREKRKPKDHIVSQKEWIACKEYFKDKDRDYCCAYCGLKIQNHYRKYAGKLMKQDLHKEHVDDGGSVYLDNCVPSCQSCNSSKRKFKIHNWYNENNPNFTHDRLNKITKWITEDYKQYFEGVRPRGKYNKKKAV